MGCFTRVQFGNSVVIGYYSSMLMYASLYSDKYLDRRYGEQGMCVSVE